MDTGYNKVTHTFITIADTTSLTPAVDWIINPIFDDPVRAFVIGCENWVTNDLDNIIHVMTPAEVEVNPMVLNSLRNGLKEETEKLRLVHIHQGYTYTDGILYNTGNEDIRNYTALCVLIALGVRTTDITIMDKALIPRTFTIAEFPLLMGAMLNYVQNVYIAFWTHNGTIDALSTVTLLEAYDITASWPS